MEFVVYINKQVKLPYTVMVSFINSLGLLYYGKMAVKKYKGCDAGVVILNQTSYLGSRLYAVCNFFSQCGKRHGQVVSE